jgi:hypothetical protein
MSSKRLNITIVLCLFLGILLLPASRIQAIEFDSAEELNRAIAHVLMKNQNTLNLLSFCRDKHPYLTVTLEKARQHWLDKNQDYVEQARHAQQLIIKDIRQRSGPFKAELYALEIDEIIKQGKEVLEQRVAAFSQQNRQRFCNRLALSIMSNEWNMEKEFETELKLINGYLEN